MEQSLTVLLARWESLLLMASAWAAIELVDRLLPSLFYKRWLWKLKPLASTIWCAGFIWAPGLRPDALWPETLLTGIILGGAVSLGHKSFRRIAKGDPS